MTRDDEPDYPLKYHVLCSFFVTLMPIRGICLKLGTISDNIALSVKSSPFNCNIFLLFTLQLINIGVELFMFCRCENWLQKYCGSHLYIQYTGICASVEKRLTIQAFQDTAAKGATSFLQCLDITKTDEHHKCSRMFLNYLKYNFLSTSKNLH